MPKYRMMLIRQYGELEVHFEFTGVHESIQEAEKTYPNMLRIDLLKDSHPDYFKSKVFTHSIGVNLFEKLITAGIETVLKNIENAG